MNNEISERMRADWNQRAREDAHYYVAFGSRDQDEEGFLATGREVVGAVEWELKRFPKNANRRAWRALEIGCGPGRLIKPLSRHFGEIHGVDVSDEMIRIARERLRDIPHAHVHAGAGAGLPQFADDSFDIVYSYAVYQHIPSRDVVLEYMRETRRVLKPGGVFRGQFNGLPPNPDPNTWSGVCFSAGDIRAFTRDNGLQLLAIEGAGTQYMWTTWRKKGLDPTPNTLSPAIRRVTNAYSSEPVAPNSGRHSALAIWIVNLPHECDLNTLDVRIDGASGTVTYVGPPESGDLQQVNVALPPGTRTGLVPVQLLLRDQPVCPGAIVRIIPAGPLVPRVIAITDGINIVHENRSTTGSLKVHIEEVLHPELITATVADRPVRNLEFMLTDPLPPRYELNFLLPEGVEPGRYPLRIKIGNRALLPCGIDVS